MSLSGALNVSRSGLRAASTWSETTAGNVANASTEGYVRRGVTLTTRNGGGAATVEVANISRDVDASLQRMHRTEISRAATQEVTANALEGYTTVLGGTDDSLSLSGRLTELQSAFDALSSNPSNSGLQRSAFEAAQGLAGELNALSGTLGEMRQDVRGGLEDDIATANERLAKLAELDARRQQTDAGTTARAGVDDQIDQQIDALSGLMDVTASRGSDGRLKLHTAGGAPLLEGGEVETLSWNRQTGTLKAGATEITPAREGVRGISEGAIAAGARLLNDTIPTFGTQLDEMARGLITTFEDADDSLAAAERGLGTNGLFTGALAGIEAGDVAAGIAVHGDIGDDVWRMRDGIGAAAEGNAGDPSQVIAFAEALEGKWEFSTEAELGDLETPADFAAGLMSAQHLARSQAQDSLDSIGTRLQSFETARSSIEGVNIDDELQQLMAIEQSYAANSKILTSVSEMLDTLLAAV